MISMANEVGPLNLGHPNKFTMIELEEKVIKLTANNSMLIFRAYPIDDFKQSQQ